MTARSPKKALFAGSFDPFTVGHASIVERALQLFDRVVIGIGVNASKAGSVPAQERAAAIKALYEGDGRVDVVVYSDRLTVDLARELGCSWLVRGVRSVKDFEYERDMADINRRLHAIDTVVLFTLPEHAAISSSVVRELAAYGHDISSFLPDKNKDKK